jgi:hypothetical protein
MFDYLTNRTLEEESQALIAYLALTAPVASARVMLKRTHLIERDTI